MNSTNFDEKNDNENHPPNMNSSFSTEESEPSESKKRKLSIGASPSLSAIKLKMLQIENDELKKVVEKLEKEDTDLKENNEPLKAKIVLLTSTINDYEEKVQILQDKNQELEENIKEKDVEICTMKTIKSEIKDSVEDERNKFQETIKKLNAEIIDLKNTNMEMKVMNQNVEKELQDSAIKYESRITELENEILTSKENCQKTLEKTENEKKLFEEILEKLKVEIKVLKEKQKYSEGIIQESNALISKYEKNDENLKKEIAEKDGKIKSLEDACLAAKYLLKAKLEQQRMTLQALIDLMKEEKDKITKKNTDLMNDIEVLQKSVNEYKKNIEEMEEKTKSETQNISWRDVYRENRKIDLSKLSCNAKKILSIPKIEAKKEGINLYHSTEKYVNPRLIKFEDFDSMCFEFKIMKELIVQSSCKFINKLIPRIHRCKLIKLHLCEQKIGYDEFCKLVSYKKVEVCILEKFQFANNIEKFDVSDILKELPNIKEFKYEFNENEDLAELGKKLQMKQLFPFNNKFKFENLKKFQLLNLSYTFDLRDFYGFIKKNDQDVCYTLKFADLAYKYKQVRVQKNKKALMDTLKYSSKSYNICIECKKY